VQDACGEAGEVGCRVWVVGWHRGHGSARGRHGCWHWEVVSYHRSVVSYQCSVFRVCQHDDEVDDGHSRERSEPVFI
jgi:hypothetical protein